MLHSKYTMIRDTPSTYRKNSLKYTCRPGLCSKFLCNVPGNVVSNVFGSWAPGPWPSLSINLLFSLKLTGHG